VISASGVKPKSFALSVWSQMASGGLSMLSSPPGSNDTKKELLSDSRSDLTAAA